MIHQEESTRGRMMVDNTFPPGIPPATQFVLVIYANCRIPGAGSFIRPGKKTDGETSFLEALKEKYATLYNYKKVVLEESGKEVEMIGFDKIEQQQRLSPVKLSDGSNLRELAIVVLDSMLIRYSNPFSEIRIICPNITSLDLSRNLFSKLSTIAETCQPLKALRTLRLTGNRFTNIVLGADLCNAFENIEWLSLNMCILIWDEACKLCTRLILDRNRSAVVQECETR